MDYEARIDKIFGGELWRHRTLRTIFDAGSSEYNKTSMDQKIAYLEKILESGEELEQLLWDYKERYIDQNNRPVADAVEDGLRRLLEYRLMKKG